MAKKRGQGGTNFCSNILAAIVAAIGISANTGAFAAQWSDTSIAWRYGKKFSEPYNNSEISKNIFSLTHFSGYRYGTNFFNVDMLLSDSNERSNASATTGAQEVYVVYRHMVSVGAVTGKEYKLGLIKDLGVSLGFDYNTKNDAGYNSKKRMLVLGPTFMLDVPGFLNISLLMVRESNAPCNTYTNPDTCVPRYTYKTHPMLTAAWGIPLVSRTYSFEGFMNYIAAKGKDEYGADTKPETNFYGQIMADIGASSGGAASVFKVGLGYQYGRNKFGIDASGPAGSSALTKTPVICAEYHF